MYNLLESNIYNFIFLILSKFERNLLLQLPCPLFHNPCDSILLLRRSLWPDLFPFGPGVAIDI